MIPFLLTIPTASPPLRQFTLRLVQNILHLHGCIQHTLHINIPSLLRQTGPTLLLPLGLCILLIFLNDLAQLLRLDILLNLGARRLNITSLQRRNIYLFRRQ